MIVIAGGTVLDGERDPYRADVLVEGDRVRDVVPGGLTGVSGGVTYLDARGCYVTPGWVDMHAHDDVAATDPAVYEAKIRQGITTVAITMDGFGYAGVPRDDTLREALFRYWRPVNGESHGVWGEDLAAYAAKVTGRLGLNVVLGVPHANVRIGAQGFALRPLTAEAYARAERTAADWAAQGAFGLSTGLGYAPAVAADVDELVRLGQAVRIHGGRLYVSHVRDYGTGLFTAVEEALEVGRRSGLAVHLSHLHLSHPTMFGRAAELLERLTAVRAAGLAVTWDTYPYTAGSSILYSYLPAWLSDGGPDALMARLADEATLARLDADAALTGFGWQRVVIAATRTGAWVGQSVADLAAARGTSPVRAIAALLREEDLVVSCIVHQTLEADDIAIAEADGCVVGTDGLPYGQRRHPRYSGAMAAFYRRHVRERGALTPTEAVRRMSIRAAELLGIGRRGPWRGAVADLAVWDPDRYMDRSTYAEPDRAADGVRHVLVGGKPVLRDEQFDPTVRAGATIASRQHGGV